MRNRDEPSSTMLGARSRCGGAALVVGLVFLLVLTVIGISGMNTATMQIAQASSTQLQHDVFGLAESAIDIALATESYSTASPRRVELLGTPDRDRTALTTYTNVNTGVPGEANSEGVTGAMVAWHFEIEAQGLGPRGAVAAHAQGFYIRGRSE
jgi:type IV pilus assembly protein PilX